MSGTANGVAGRAARTVRKVRRGAGRAALWLVGSANRRRAGRAPRPDTRTVRILLLHAYGMLSTRSLAAESAAHMQRLDVKDALLFAGALPADQPRSTCLMSGSG